MINTNKNFNRGVKKLDSKRINEINARKEEIRNLLQSESEINVEEIRSELEKLNSEESELRSKHELAASININKIETKEIEKPKQVEERNMKKDNGIFCEEYRQAVKDYITTGDTAELRAAGVSSMGDIPFSGQIQTTIVEKLSNYGQILPEITNTHFAKGSEIPVSNIRPVATFVAEGTTSDKQKMGYTMVNIAGHKLRCAVAETIEASTMSLDDFENLIAENIAVAMAQKLEQTVISGSEALGFKGITQFAPAKTINAAAVDYDTLIEAEAAVPSQYEAGTCYVMSKATFLSLKSVKDANKRPILDTNDITNKQLLGRNVIICDYLPSIDKAAPGETFAFLFRMKDYILNTCIDVGIKQYEDYDTDNIVRKAIMVVDGLVIDNSSLVLLNKA